MAVQNPTPTYAPCVGMWWKNYLDISGQPFSMMWPELFDLLSKPEPYQGEEKHPGWSPIVCDPPTRKDASVTALSALALDFDGTMSLEEARELFRPYYGIIHTTRKHSPDVHRFRVVLVFSRLVTPDEHLRAWVHFQDLVGRRLDAKCRNVSRLWFKPSMVEGGIFESFQLDGEPIDIDALLAIPPPYSAPPASGPIHSLADRIRRASAYLGVIPPAIAGQNGHGQTWNAALKLVRGFDLPEGAAIELLTREYNPRCQPPWSARELEHKVWSASKDSGLPRGFLLDEPAREPAYEARKPDPDVEREAIRDGPRTSEGPSFTALTLDEMLAPLPPVNDLVQSLDMSPGRPAQFVGTGFVGKTLIAQSMAMSIALGERVWGEFECRQGDVAHFDYEMGRRPTLRRYRRLAIGMGVPWEDIAPHLKVYPTPNLYLNSHGIRDAVKRAVDGCAFAILDSLRRSVPGQDENDSTITQHLDALLRISEETECTFVFMHHETTKGREGDSRGAGRGSSAIYDCSGSVLRISGSTKDDPRKVEHTRAHAHGITTPDFFLRIADVPVGLDAFAGLRVTTLPAEAIAQSERVKERQELAKDIERLVAACRGAGAKGVSGADPLGRLAGMKLATARAAVRIAIDRGLLINKGSERRPRLVVPPEASNG